MSPTLCQLDKGTISHQRITRGGSSNKSCKWRILRIKSRSKLFWSASSQELSDQTSLRTPPKTLLGVIKEAQKHVIAKGLTITGESRHQVQLKEEQPKVKEGEVPTSYWRKAKIEQPLPPLRPKRSKFDKYTPLTLPRKNILPQIQN